MRNLCKFLIILLGALGFGAVASANIFTDIGHWIHKEYNAVRDAEKELEKQIEKSEKYVAKVMVDAEVALAKEIEKDINAAIKFIKSIDLNELQGACEASQEKMQGPLKSVFNSKFMGQMAKQLPRVHLGSTGDSLKFLTGPSCLMDQMVGYRCGMVPYIKDIIVAISEGKADIHHFSSQVGKAYKSHTCKSYSDGVERGVCAVLAGGFSEAKKGTACVQGVVEEIASELQHQKKHGGGKSLSANQKSEICRSIGNLEYSFVADAELAGIANNISQPVAKITRIAMKLRTGLGIQHKLKNPPEFLCTKSIKKHVKQGLVPTEKIVRLGANNKVPGKNLKLFTDLSDPLCMDYLLHQERLGTRPCHGKVNQRWNFDQKEVTIKGEKHYRYRVQNSHKKQCLKASGKDQDFLFASCDDFHKDSALQFHITKAGLLKNEKTQQCITRRGADKHVHGGACDEKNKNQILYKSDPSLSLVKGNPGSNKHLYNSPTAPQCLMGERTGKTITHFDGSTSSEYVIFTDTCEKRATQLWTFKSYKNIDAKYRDYYQIRNVSGQCVTTGTTKGEVKLMKCHAMDSDADGDGGGIHLPPGAIPKEMRKADRQHQMFAIDEGTLKSYVSGLCLDTHEKNSEFFVQERKCDPNKDQQKWHILNAPH